MNKKEKGRIYRFVNENAFLTTKLGDGYEKEHRVIDVPELFHFVKALYDESDKVVIPKFVAEYIEKRKALYPIGSMGGAITTALSSNMDPEFGNWINSNMEVFARAWLDGYKFEEEPIWIIKKGDMYFYGWLEDNTVAGFVTELGHGTIEQAKKYESAERAIEDASVFGGAVELYKEESKHGCES